MRLPNCKSLRHLPVVFLMVVFCRIVSAQPKERLVEWPTDPIGRVTVATRGIKVSTVAEALEIVDITVAGRSITVGHPFPAADDWLRSLKFRMRNISGQPIRGARISFDLPETSIENRSLGFSLEYVNGLSTGIPADEQKGIMPDEEFEFQFDDAQYERHRKFVSERTTLASFSKVRITWTAVRFEDGSSWVSGCLRSVKPKNACTPRSP